MAHLTPDGRRLVLTRDDIRPAGDSFSIEFPSGAWIEFTQDGDDVNVDCTTAENAYDVSENVIALENALRSWEE